MRYLQVQNPTTPFTHVHNYTAGRGHCLMTKMSYKTDDVKLRSSEIFL